MKLYNYINERIINTTKLNKIIEVFSNVPSSNTPEAIADYIVKSLKAVGIKSEHGNYTYLSGPMTNLPDDNWPVFIHAGKYLSGKVINPANPHGGILNKDKSTFDWFDYMTEDIYDLVKCNKIILLPGYSKSTGARTEIHIGKKLLGIKPKLFKDVVGEKKYKQFIKDVKKQYLKDGFDKEYYGIIEPMLTAKSESEAAKYVKTFKPSGKKNESINENIMKSIKNFVNYIKDGSLKSILKLLGLILKKNNIKKLDR